MTNEELAEKARQILGIAAEIRSGNPDPPFPLLVEQLISTSTALLEIVEPARPAPAPAALAAPIIQTPLPGPTPAHAHAAAAHPAPAPQAAKNVPDSGRGR